MNEQDGKDKTQKPRSNDETLWGLPRTVVSFAVIALTSVIVYRIATAHSFPQFDFTAFLSLLMAFFAVALSALFYFKATESSNLFYDNTYKFTKDISEILGRIEAGFGERLRHLDEGYSGLRDRFEKLPFDVSKAKEKEEKEKQEVAKKEAELQHMFEELAKRAKLAEGEKTALFARLEQTQQELDLSRRDLLRVQRRIRNAEEPDALSPDFKNYLSGVVTKNFPPGIHVRPLSMVNRVFKDTVLKELSEMALDYMKTHDLLDEDKDLTRRGAELVRDLASRTESNN